jgi:SNF2 family DNA or RNA helicase
LSGTPLENHLGELWSLFRVLNPGLLGTKKSFAQKLQSPIERDGDALARQRLQHLIRPFILRRTKSQVLEELPPRTELTLSVELSAAERELYESHRQLALARLEQAEDSSEQRIQIFAELTRLRQLCCHPRLVQPDSQLSSSKLETLLELVDELRENGHRALVFSQFVKHLALVEEAFTAKGLEYQYLDGSTKSSERQRRIDAFQDGEADFFLISLKAGGTGLNLTGADYVIHLDPWWNPAVEDQASDRAHRIGQTRPVTVYRLVAADTIEEKLVELHQRKRELAEQILEGTHASARIDADELLALLRGI